MTDTLKEQHLRLVKDYKRTDDVFHAYAVRQGLSDCAFWLLYALCEDDRPYTQNDLCEQWYYSKQTVNSAVSNLIKAGYIDLISGARNRKLISLTPVGQKYVEAHIRPVIEAEQRALAGLTAEERSLYIALSERHTQLLADELDSLSSAVIPT